MFSIKTMCQRVIYLKKGKVVFDGPTDEGLRMYENDSRLKETYWFHRDGDELPITFTEASVESSGGVNTGVVEHGEPLTFRMRYKTTRRIEKPEIRLSIDREDDQHIMTFSNTLEGLELPYLEGEGELVVTAPPLKLTSDFYLANVAVRENNNGKLLIAQIVGHFHVRHPTYSSTAYGVLHEPGKWSHAPVSATAAPALAAVAPTKAAS